MEGVGLVAAVLDREDGAGGQTGGADEVEEFGLLVEDAGDDEFLAEGAVDEIHVAGRGDGAADGGDGVAVGIDGGVAEEGVHAFKHSFAGDVFPFLGFGVDFGPIEAEDLDEEELDEAVPAEDFQGGAFSEVGEADAEAGRIANEPSFGEAFDHGGGGARGDAYGRGEAPHGDVAFFLQFLFEVKLLEVVFAGARGHGRS